MDSLHILKELAKDLTLLYVEDSDKMREQASLFFQKFFAHTVVAKDGKEALEIYGKCKPDIVVTDISMPYVSGLELAKKIKKHNPKIKIIITSAYDDKEKLMQAIEIGVYKYLKKPITIDILSAALIDCIESVKLDDKRDVFEDQVKKIFDNQNSLLAFYKHKKLKLANHPFLEFFGVENIQEFTQRYRSIGMVLEKKSGFLSDLDDKTWLEIAMDESSKFFNAIVLGNDFKKYHFLISAHKIPDSIDEVIVSMSDITNLNLYNLDEEIPQNELAKSPKYPQDSIESLMYVLKLMKDKSQSVKILNFYKGLTIVHDGIVKDVGENYLRLQSDRLQIRAALMEHFVILRNSLLSKDLKCNVLKSSQDDEHLILNSFEQLERSPSERKFPRLQPEDGTKGFLFVNLKEYEVAILDISISSVRIFDFTLPPGLKQDSQLWFETKLHIAQEEFVVQGGLKQLRLEERLDGYEMIFELILQKTQNQNLAAYISKRQLELIREFKGIRYAD